MLTKYRGAVHLLRGKSKMASLTDNSDFKGTGKINLTKKRVYMIIKMFSGTYVDGNLAHEIINLYKPDNESKYCIYVPSYGERYKDMLDVVTDAVFITEWGRDEKNLKLYKIIGTASIDKDDQPQDENVLKTKELIYGGRKIEDIFDDLIDTKLNRFTLVASNVEIWNKPITLSAEEILKEKGKGNHENNQAFGHQCVYLGKDSKSSLIGSDDFERLIKEKRKGAYPEKAKDFKYVYSKSFESNLLSIIQRIYDENAVSNYIKAAFDEDSKTAKDFFEEILNVNFAKDPITVLREVSLGKKESKSGRADLIIYNKTEMVLIENKIDSSTSKGQLEKYKKSLEDSLNKDDTKILKTLKGIKNKHFFVLKSNGRTPCFTISTGYKVFTYGDLADFYDKHKATAFKIASPNRKYFDDGEFVNTMRMIDATKIDVAKSRFSLAIEKKARR